jgi:1-hydroxycarotenoid 3,4-desaturase
VSAPRVVVIGAGVGGLAAALDLAARGAEVTVLERAATPGGKLREVAVGGARIDAGPTVFTMRWVFEELFEQAGLRFAEHVDTEVASTLARHAWGGGAQLDLHADLSRSAEAIGEFSGAAEARRFLEFAQRARRIYQTLEGPFIRRSCASPQALMRAVGARGMGDLWAITPFETMWRALGKHFHDPRLRQLFGRYATYCGSSPFSAPATLMLVAHVEQEGVWLVRNGMHRLAQALVGAASSRGATIRYNADVARIATKGGRISGVQLQTGEHFDCDAVICNADTAAVSDGLFGRDAAAAVPRPRGLVRSLSAMTFNLLARSKGFELLRHSVFFSDDYAAEFDDVFRRSRVPAQPTVYICAQDRGADAQSPAPAGAERLLCLINAPANGDTHAYDAAEIRSCQTRTFEQLQRCGLSLDAQATQVTTPADFHRLFPATGGALYGPASHGWTASFNRAQAASRLPGLYLAGGSAHPGPGVPMAALSGRIAAARLMADLDSISKSRTVAMPGGMSMR